MTVAGPILEGNDLMTTTRSTYLACLTITVLAYLGLYGLFLGVTQGLPYVCDNNESFSALWHAHNLYHFPFGDSFGVTDEASSPHQEAHPFVHTHQGNFPRLFAWVLYALHARSVQSQIVITTLTIGLGTILLGFHLFARWVSPLFALIAMIFLMTDYVMFMQWQVVTYRVWHGFLVFASLASVEHAREGRRLWSFLTVLIFASTFYYEIVFALFVTVTTCVFALFILWSDKRVFARIAALSAGGAMLGASALLVQLVLYMGFDATVQDITYTIRARQFTTSETGADEELVSFFEKHKIVFFHNFENGTIFQSPQVLVHQTLIHHFGAYSPLNWIPVFMVVGGFFCGRGLDLLGGRWTIPKEHLLLGPEANRPYLYYVRWISLGFLISILFLTSYYFAKKTLGMHVDKSSSSLQAIHDVIFDSPGNWYLTLHIGALALSCSAFGSFVPRYSPFVIMTRALLASALTLAVSYASIRMNMHSSGITIALASSWYSLFCLLVLNVGASIVGCTFVLGGQLALPNVSAKTNLRLLAFLGAGAIGYLAICALFGGYVLSGYLARRLSFFLYFTNILFAIAAYLLIHFAISTYRTGTIPRELVASISKHAIVQFVLCRVKAIGVVARVSIWSWAWVELQLIHFQHLPPDQRSFLSELSETPYAGKTFVCTSYPAPIAWMTRQWALFDPYFKPGNVQLGESGYLIQRNMRDYVWLADGASNSAYLRPDYHVSVDYQNLSREMERIKRGALRKPVQSERIMQKSAVMAGLNSASPLHHRLVSFDETGLNRWAIAELDWDFPPYLRRLHGPDSDGRVAIQTNKTPAGHVVHVRYDFCHQDGKPEEDSIVRLFAVSKTGKRAMLAQGTRQREFLLESGIKDNIQASVTPLTGTKRGLESYSNYVPIENTYSLEAPSLKFTDLCAVLENKGSTSVRVRYVYYHPHEEPETNSILRLYLESKTGDLILLKEAKGVKEIDVPPLPSAVHDDTEARLRVAVVPTTQFTAGREYFAPQAFAVNQLPRCSSPVNWQWPPAPTMTYKLKRDSKTTLLIPELIGAAKERVNADGDFRIQLHVWGQDNSFRLMRDLIGEPVLILDTDAYDMVRITILSPVPNASVRPVESLLIKLQ